jgi:hypothetical protein
VTRAQREVQSRRQQSGKDTGETVADTSADPRLEQMAARLERVESLLLELTRR